MKVRAVLYKAVVYTVLLYGCDSWVVTDAMMTVLKGFHHRVARRLAVLTVILDNNGKWEWSSVSTAL